MSRSQVIPAARFEARFEAFDGHRSMVVSWRPRGAARAQALWLPAFGDEMNQTRRMVRLASEALADRGVSCHLFDALGTGDSSADFEAASVECWLADCERMIERIVARAPGQPLVLLGCRLGVALAVAASRRLAEPAALLVGWAPVLQGRLQLSGLLRASRMASMQRPDAGQPLDPTREWAQGRPVRLAGYPVSAALAAGLDALDVTATPPSANEVTLIDVRMPLGDEPPTPAKPLLACSQAWASAGVPTVAKALAGAAFWNVADLVDVPALVDETVAALAVRGLA